jgi:hypothetical protein
MNLFSISVCTFFYCYIVQGKSLVENGFGYLESFVKSEAGRRLVGVIPRLVAAKNMEKMLEVRKDDVQSKLKATHA